MINKILRLTHHIDYKNQGDDHQIETKQIPCDVKQYIEEKLRENQ